MRGIDFHFVFVYQSQHVGEATVNSMQVARESHLYHLCVVQCIGPIIIVNGNLVTYRGQPH